MLLTIIMIPRVSKPTYHLSWKILSDAPCMHEDSKYFIFTDDRPDAIEDLRVRYEGGRAAALRAPDAPFPSP